MMNGVDRFLQRVLTQSGGMWHAISKEVDDLIAAFEQADNDLTNES